MYATVLEQHLRDYSPNVLFYTPLQVDDVFVFVLHRLFRTLSCSGIVNLATYLEVHHT